MKEYIHRIVVPSAFIVAAGVMPGYATTYLTAGQARSICFSDATRFLPADVQLTPQQMAAVEKSSGVRVRLKTQKVWRAMRGEAFLGWVIEDEVLGKHEFINWTLALNPDGSVRHIEIIDYRETYGFQIRDEQWRSQFYGKRNGAKLKLDDDVKNISGATLSCRHITDGVKRLLAFYETVLKH